MACRVLSNHRTAVFWLTRFSFLQDASVKAWSLFQLTAHAHGLLTEWSPRKMVLPHIRYQYRAPLVFLVRKPWECACQGPYARTHAKDTHTCARKHTRAWHAHTQTHTPTYVPACMLTRTHRNTHLHIHSKFVSLPVTLSLFLFPSAFSLFLASTGPPPDSVVLQLFALFNTTWRECACKAVPFDPSQLVYTFDTSTPSVFQCLDPFPNLFFQRSFRVEVSSRRILCNFEFIYIIFTESGWPYLGIFSTNCQYTYVSLLIR